MVEIEETCFAETIIEHLEEFEVHGTITFDVSTILKASVGSHDDAIAKAYEYLQDALIAYMPQFLVVQTHGNKEANVDVNNVSIEWTTAYGEDDC